MSISTPTVEGLRHTGVAGAINRRELSLPKEFDSKKFAAKWVKKGARVEQAQQVQHLGEGYEADGWQVWKWKGQICQRSLSDGPYILMVRPKGLQQAVNAIYGNQSRKRIIDEQEGKTAAGDAVSQGILTNAHLSQLENMSREPDEAPLTLNKISPLETAGAVQASAKPKRRL